VPLQNRRGWCGAESNASVQIGSAGGQRIFWQARPVLMGTSARAGDAPAERLLRADQQDVVKEFWNALPLYRHAQRVLEKVEATSGSSIATRSLHTF